MIGKGSFGEVLLVKRKNTDKQYAMKAIDKAFLYKVFKFN
jgi:serine/threonine protein kinase